MFRWVENQSAKLVIAACVASLLHSSLLLIDFKWMSEDLATSESQTLKVVIQNPSEQRKEERETLPKPEPSPPQKPRKDLSTDSVVVRQAIKKEEKPIRIPSVQSEAFKKFLEQETDIAIQNNPSQIEEFDQSFELPSADYNEELNDPEVLLKHMQQTGVGMTEDKYGRRRCYALSHNMFDIDASPIVLSRDCTPPKKFELNLDKARKG